MSEPILQSGRFRGTPAMIQAAVVNAVGNGAYQGMELAIDQISPEIAKKTGAFRETFREAALEHIDEQLGETFMRLDTKVIADKMIARLEYAEHHVDGKPHHPGDLTPYDDPTTPGTRPLDTVELARVANPLIKERINALLIAQGLDIRIR